MNTNNPDSSKDTSLQGLCPPPSTTTTTNVARDNETHSRQPSINIARHHPSTNIARHHPSTNIAGVPAETRRHPPPVAGDLDESCPRPPPPRNVPAAANETRPHPRPNLNVPGASETHEKPKKKKKQKKTREIIVGGETTTLRLGCDPNMQFEVGSTSKKPKSKPKPKRKIPDLNIPLIKCPCVTCGSGFPTIKALFGHMRCHTDRGWRGIIPPEERRRRKRKPVPASADPQGSGLGRVDRNQRKRRVPASADPQGSGLGRVDINQDDQEVAKGLLMLANGVLSSMDDNHQGSLETVDSKNHRHQCSSCKRVFGSHQALGGHRASHKKVRGCFAITFMNSNDSNNENRNNEDDSNGSNGNGSYDPKGKGKAKVTDEEEIVSGHICGICGKSFGCGQALGGHMRCHWFRTDQNSSSSSMMMFQQQQQQQLGAGILFNPSTTTAGCSTSYANVTPSTHEWDGGSTGFALDLNETPSTHEPAEPEPEPEPEPVDEANGIEGDSSTSSTPSSEMDLDLKLGF